MYSKRGGAFNLSGIARRREGEIAQMKKIQEQEEQRKKLIQKVAECDIIEEEPLDPAAEQVLESQMVDLWGVQVANIEKIIDHATDLRINLADDALMNAQDEDISCVKFLKGIISEWRIRLFSLSDDDLRAKKQELKNLWVSLYALEPLFNGLNNHELTRDISELTEEIVEALRAQKFRHAINAYNRLAIGNSLWPIGVTQYSIHWKFSCDRVASEKSLHLFNNERSRQAVIAIKRLMNQFENFHKTPIH